MRVETSILARTSYVTLIAVLVLGCAGNVDSSAPNTAEPVQPGKAIKTEVAATVPAGDTDVESASGAAETADAAEPEPVEEKSPLQIDWSHDRPSGAFDREYRGRFLLTYVERGPLYARTAPSRNAPTLTKLSAGDPVVVTGVTPFIEMIDGQTAPWVRIEYGADAEDLVRTSGLGRPAWMFAAYLSDFPDASPHVTSAEHSSAEVFPRTITLRLGDRSQRVSLAHMGRQPFGVFVRAPGADGFHYTETPGTYVWNRDTDQIRHMGYFGAVIEAEPSMFTNDLRYRIDGFGTGVTGRTYRVTRISTDEVVARISGARGLSFDGQTMEVSVTERPQLDQYTPGAGEIEAIVAQCLGNDVENATSSAAMVATIRYTFESGDFSLVECTEQIGE